MIRLVTVKGNPDADGILWMLLEERPKDTFISHESMPTHEEHNAFVANHPFRYWYLIDHPQWGYIGALECSFNNEIGISILANFRRHGFGSEALSKFMTAHVPLPAIPAVRNGKWLANIAKTNQHSKIFFMMNGFKPIQETLAYG